MKEFKYIAYDKKGKTIKGFISANRIEDAKRILEGKGLYVVEIKEVKRINLNIQIAKSIKDEELILFTNEFGTLIRAGLTVVDALQGLADQTENNYFRSVILDIKDAIESGTPLSVAFKKYPNVFSSIYTSLLSVGEATGRLDKVLEGLSSYLERDLDIRRKISSAFAYPKFVVLVVTGVVIFMLSVVLPRFVAMFSSAGANLPTPTKILISVSNFIRFKWYILLMFVVAIYVLYRVLYSIPKTRVAIDRIKLSIPIFGKIYKLGALSRFSRSLALIIGSGLSIVEGIDIAKSVANNYYIESELNRVITRIKEGESFKDALSKGSVFPKILVQMVAVGEKSGALDSSLLHIADLWDQNLDFTLRNLSSKIEPTLIVILGVVVGFIAIAMYLPMFSLPSLINK